MNRVYDYQVNISVIDWWAVTLAVKNLVPLVTGESQGLESM